MKSIVLALFICIGFSTGYTNVIKRDIKKFDNGLFDAKFDNKLLEILNEFNISNNDSTDKPITSNLNDSTDKPAKSSLNDSTDKPITSSLNDSFDKPTKSSLNDSTDKPITSSLNDSIDYPATIPNDEKSKNEKKKILIQLRKELKKMAIELIRNDQLDRAKIVKDYIRISEKLLPKLKVDKLKEKRFNNFVKRTQKLLIEYKN